MKKIIKTVLILLILGGIGFMMFNIFDNNKYKNDSIDKCTYSHGGGMLGDVYSVSARKLKDGSSELVIQQAPSHNERIVTKTYKIDNNIFEEIKKIMLDYNLYKASKKGKSPFEVLDAPSTSLYLSFEKNDSFSVNDYQNLSNKDFEGINNILDKMLSYASGDPIISIEPHELALSIDGYNIFYYINESKASE